MERDDKRITTLHIAFIALLSFIPFLWLKPGQAILGHDAGFPLSPWPHFLDRLMAWTHRFGLGNDQTTEIGGFFIHGFEGVVSWLGFTLTQTQQITFSVYFFLFGMSSYIFARTVFPKRKTYFPLMVSVMYMLNHFILQAWFIVERTKFTQYIALPLLLALLIRVSRKQSSPIRAAAAGALIMFVFNGGGFLPLFGSVIISIPTVSLLLIILHSEKIQRLKRISIFLVSFAVLTIGISGFWVVPYINFISTSFSAELETAGGVSGVLAWLTYISEHSSFYNIFRLHGIQEWYVNPLHPYAQTLLLNPFFYLVSYSVFFLAFLSTIIANAESKKTIQVFMGLSLVAMFMMAGSHPPFGFIYVWMIENIPGFVAFRTPFYKFAPALWLSYAVLIAFTIDVGLKRIQIKHPRWVIVPFFIVIAVWSTYNYPFFTGTFFDYEKDQKTTKVTVPEYVFEYADWAQSEEFPYRRLLLLPGQNPDTHFEAYTWGYWSLAQLQGLLTNNSYIGNSQYKSATEEIFIQNLFALVDKGDQAWVDQAQYLFVDAVLLRKDFDYTLENSPATNPSKIEKFLDNDPRFKKTKEFGEWAIYELVSEPQPFAFKNYFYELHAQNKEKFFEPATLDQLDIDADTVFLEKPIKTLQERNKGIIYIPECVHCLLGNRSLYPVDRNQLITAGSVIYPIKRIPEENKLRSIKDPFERLEFLTQMSTRRLYELQNQFVRKEQLNDRMKGWAQYTQSLRLVKNSLIENLEEIEVFDHLQNEAYTRMLENVEQHIQEVKDTLQAEVNHDDEATEYIKTTSILSEIQNILLDNRVWYSRDNLQKRYLLTIPDKQNSGTYDVYMKRNTSNAYEEDLQVATNTNLRINGVEYPATYAGVDQTNNPWTYLSSVEMDKGENRIELDEPDIKEFLGNEDGTATLEYSQKKQCAILPVGHLNRDTYKINMELYAEKDADDLYLFVNQVGDDRTLLPYWGRRLIVDGQKTTHLNFNEEIRTATDYELKFCRLTAKEIDGEELEVRNLYRERVSTPLLLFLKKNEYNQTAQSTLSLDVVEHDVSTFDITTTGTGSAILMYDQRFDNGWEFTPDTLYANHRSVHGYANGWGIQKRNESSITTRLTYKAQQFLVLGWRISIAVATISLIIIASSLYKRREKK